MNSNPALIKSVSITFLAKIAIFFIGLAGSIILARILEPSGRGIYALIILVPVLLLKIGTLGIEVANVYFSGSRKYKLNDITSNSFVAAISLGLILILLFLGIFKVPAFKDFMNSKNIIPLYLWLAVFTLPFALLYDFFIDILVGREKIINYNQVSIVRETVLLGFIIIFLIILSKGLFGAVLAYIISILASVLVVTLFVKRIAKIRLKVNSKLFRESLRYGGKAYLGNLAQFLNYRLDMLLVAYFLTPAALGYYAVAVGVAEKLWMIPASVSVVLFPRVSSIEAKQANILTPKVSRNTLFIIFIGSLIVFIFAKLLIKLLFGSVYIPSVNPLIILLPGIIALSVAKVLTSDLAGRGRPEFGAFSSFASLAVNIPLNLWLIPKWGISGAAFASTVAYCLSTIIVIIAFLKLSKNTWSNTLLIKRADFQLYLNTFSKTKTSSQPSRLK